MIHKLKVLTLAILAVLAPSAMVASAAMAAEFHSAGAPTTISGSQVGTNALHLPDAGTLECTTARFHSSQSTTAIKELTVHPTWSGCKAFGFATMDITTTGSNFTFTQPNASTQSVTHIVCSGNPIRITPTVFGGSVCTITFGSQSPSGVVDFKNEASGKVLLTWTITSISHSAGCGASPASDGVYTGSVLLQGSNGAISIS